MPLAQHRNDPRAICQKYIFTQPDILKLTVMNILIPDEGNAGATNAPW
jgi:hypothetical protein